MGPLTLLEVEGGDHPVLQCSDDGPAGHGLAPNQPSLVLGLEVHMATLDLQQQQQTQGRATGSVTHRIGALGQTARPAVRL